MNDASGVGGNGDDVLAVKPAKACKMLDIGITRLYELIESGALQSYKDGSSRKVTTASIRAYVDRQVQHAVSEAGRGA